MKIRLFQLLFEGVWQVFQAVEIASFVARKRSAILCLKEAAFTVHNAGFESCLAGLFPPLNGVLVAHCQLALVALLTERLIVL